MAYAPIPAWRRIAISAFIIFHVVAIPFYSTSELEAHQSAIQVFFSRYLVWTRLNQSWPLFVPSPRQYAKRYHVDIVFKDGSTAIWRRPYSPNWDFWERHLAYNFQKWDLANNYLDRKGLLWSDLAHFVQLTYWTEQNPPATITLVKEEAQWLPPNQTGYAWHDGEEDQLKWKNETLFTFSVAENHFR